MKQFKTVFGYELMTQIKNKAFIGVTIFLVVVIAGALFLPRIFASDSSNEGSEKEGKTAKLAILVEGDVDKELAEQVFTEEAQAQDRELAVETSLDALKEKVMSGDYVCGYAIHDLKNYTYYVETLSVYDTNEASNAAMMRLNYYTMMKQSGMSLDEIKKAADITIEGVPEVLGNDQSQNYFYTYIMIFALYMIILLYGQMVATSVASEKSSRAMEVLITSAKPVSLMFGKILAACSAGMGQLILIFGTAFVCYNVNKEYLEGIFIFNSIFNIPASMILFMLLFFLLGFLLYAMMFGAIGSMATKVEDINTLQTPVTMLFVIAFMIVIFGMNGDVNSPIMVVASYIPFTSPMAMFTRVVMGDIMWYEIAASVAILVASTIGIGILSARIYRAGVLHYGKAPKFMEMLAKAKN